jgi:endonuclease/exonuclease/phosphatase family metal-dependent hydrolase
MTRESNAERQIIQQLFAVFLQLSTATKVILIVGVLILAGAIYAFNHLPSSAQPGGGASEAGSPDVAEGDVGDNVPPPAVLFPPGSRSVLFCVWNMENLFDDRNDHHPPPDAEFDSWFAEYPAVRIEKYQHISSALLKFNDGKGPDIIVGNEVESLRAAELLKDALNASLPAGAARYEHIAVKELSNAGRHIAPAVISRFPLGRTRTLGHRQRILETHVTVNGHDLDLVASHWTSQLSDDGHRQVGGRHGYATVIEENYREACRANPKVDYLVCGDFNDTPNSEPVVQTLHMVSDYHKVVAGETPPRLFGLLSGRPPSEYGTIYYKKPLIYDQIGVSPGMFDDIGWGYDPASVRVPAEGLVEPGAARHPWRFGSPKDTHRRGYSDHLPVLVTLKVAPDR